jgi:hypothetical protein
MRPTRPHPDLVLALGEFTKQANLVRAYLPTIQADDILNCLSWANNRPASAALILKRLDQARARPNSTLYPGAKGPGRR